MANKTQPTGKSATQFLNLIEDDRRRKDCKAIAKIMKQATGQPAKMWGKSIIGFGTYHYKYSSGREGDWFLTGFSPRKNNLVLYIMAGFTGYTDLMAKLGKYKTGKSCLYIKSLDDVDPEILRELVSQSIAYMKKVYQVL